MFLADQDGMFTFIRILFICGESNHLLEILPDLVFLSFMLILKIHLCEVTVH